MLHTSRPDNSSDVLLQLHTAPNCFYRVRLVPAHGESVEASSPACLFPLGLGEDVTAQSFGTGEISLFLNSSLG